MERIYGLIFTAAVMAATSSIISCGSGDRMPTERSHSFHDISRYAAMFENPEREKWQRPDLVVSAMKLKSGDLVADMGAGTGYFARRIAKAVAPGGAVTGYDIEPKMVEYMREDSKRLGYASYRAELSSGIPSLPRGRFDVIFMCNTYHHVDDRVPFIRALAMGLKKTGRIIVIDQRVEAPNGPPKHLRLAKKDIIAEFTFAGFVPARDENFLPDQYYLEFRAR